MTKTILYPHQEDAHKAVLEEFKVSSRCHIVMACGTGKTLTAVAIADSLDVNSIVVFVPSLALINQFMKTWVLETEHQDSEYLCVCSDNSITDDVEQSSLLLEPIDFPITIESESIRIFLGAKSPKRKVIFCTYQSCELLSGLSLDFSVFDEAHKTAGYDKKTFSFPLSDSNVSLDKRLFITATPRHGVRKKGNDGEEKLLYSMDDISIYGNRVYTLNFREAINKGLICDYKIIISVINVESETYKFNEKYDIQEKSIALQKAINEVSAKKVITFHSSIKSASNFSKFYKTLFTDVFHINSNLTMQVRSDSMKKFREYSKAIITNARCLTEGVDVPSVDMVAFLNPKSSKIDIIQAIGRALRNSPGKEKGYIFLPLMINEKEIDKVEFSEYSHIWQVLNTLMEQDTELSDLVKNLSERNREHYNKEKIDFGDHINILADDKFLNKFIKIKILENIKYDWYEMFGQLKSWNGKSPLNPYLTLWINKQRNEFEKGILPEDKVKELNSINFIFDIDGYNWMKDFEDYKIYLKYKRESYKHYIKCAYNKSIRDDPGQYGFPISEEKRMEDFEEYQRRLKGKNKLKSYQLDLLKSINFTFDFNEAYMDYMERTDLKYIMKFLKDVQYRQDYGDAEYFKRIIRNFKDIIRKAKRKHKPLSKFFIQELTDHGFPWEIEHILKWKPYNCNHMINRNFWFYSETRYGNYWV